MGEWRFLKPKKMRVVLISDMCCALHPCSQMKKRLRAEIYSSYVKMGQNGMDVDPELYEVVSSKLASTLLCGNYARESPCLPPREERKRRERLPRFTIEDSSIDTIVAEELPSRVNWHRYLVRWRGYHPSWEAWRLPGRGAPGDPVESWEPASNLIGTRALAEWKAQHASAM